jgi:hypothetical protein
VLEEERGRIEAGDRGPQAGKPVGDPPVPAGEVEDLASGAHVEHAPDERRVGITGLLERGPVEVQVVVAEDLVEVKLGHVHRPRF